MSFSSQQTIFTMLSKLTPGTALRTSALASTKPRVIPSINRLFNTTPILPSKDPKMSSGPPKHEMQYFPNMTTAMPSKSGEFRRVLWTGLYSQVVLMTVPVGGDIGDEVGLSLAIQCLGGKSYPKSYGIRKRNQFGQSIWRRST